MTKYLLLFCFIVLAGCSTDVIPDRKPVRLNFAFKSIQVGHDSLLPVFPNPFSRITGDTSLMLNFTMKDSGQAIVLIQNVVGDEIAGFSDSLLAPGTYSGHWNPTASDGTPLLSGLYFVTLHVHDYIRSRLVNIQNND